MKWIVGNDCHPPREACHSLPGAQPGKEPAFRPSWFPGAPFLASFARKPALSLPKGGALAALLFLTLCSMAATQTPQDLLATGRVDQAIQMLEQQIQTLPTAEAYNLLCRAHSELGAWDAGIPACEKAASLAPDNSLYHLWLGRIYGEKADRANFLSAAGLAGKVRGEFERAVQLNPKDVDARLDLAEFYLAAPGVMGGGEQK